MTLDSWLVSRLAREIHGKIAGARVRDIRSGPGGFVLSCYRRGALELRVSLDPESPLAAVTEPTNENSAPGWAAAVATRLRASIIEAVHAVRSDRIIDVGLVSRSSFGVPARFRLVIELEPRKSNAVVLRQRATDDRWLIVAAAKQFTPSRGGRRIQTGEPYELPPPRTANLDRGAFQSALSRADDIDPREMLRLLAGYDPDCTPPLAREVLARAANDAGPPFYARLLEHWERLRAEVAEKSAGVDTPIYVYRSGGAVVAIHVVRLGWPGTEPAVESSLNALCAEQMRAPKREDDKSASALQRRLATLLERCDEEMTTLHAARAKTLSAESLRRSGEAIYANLHLMKPGATFLETDGERIVLDPKLSPKENAALYFRRYKKAKSGLPHIDARLASLAENHRYWEELNWELERARDLDSPDRNAAYREIASAIGLRARAPRRAPVARPKARADILVEISAGARAYVGRSPKDNERITFAVASPNDFWFHARGIPGAHVILKVPQAHTEPSKQQILEAAALAAGHSRAANAAKVEVDYTRRKHVRRVAKGKPGLVYYTDAQTVLVKPAR